jgi:hypothetical protein
MPGRCAGVNCRLRIMKEPLSVSGGAFRLVILAACLSAGMNGGQGSAALTEIMKRAHAYVAVYEDHELSTVMARERYRQQW